MKIDTEQKYIYICTHTHIKHTRIYNRKKKRISYIFLYICQIYTRNAYTNTHIKRLLNNYKPTFFPKIMK